MTGEEHAHALSSDEESKFIAEHVIEYAKALKALRGGQPNRQCGNVLYRLAYGMLPDNVEAMRNLADAYIYARQYEKAVGLYQKIAKKVRALPIQMDEMYNEALW